MEYGEAFDILLSEIYESGNCSKYEFNSSKRELAHDLVDDACYKADKYKWHYLEYNPDDLPQNLHRYYLYENKWGQIFKGVFRLVGNYKMFETHIYSAEHGGDIWLRYKVANITRWKEID